MTPAKDNIDDYELLCEKLFHSLSYVINIGPFHKIIIPQELEDRIEKQMKMIYWGIESK